MPTTPYTWVLLLVGIVVVLAGSGLALYVVARPAGRRRMPPARRPDSGLVREAGRVYVSRAAAGAVNARDRVVASPVMEAGATTHPAYPTWTAPVSRHVQVRTGRHREPAGVAR